MYETKEYQDLTNILIAKKMFSEATLLARAIHKEVNKSLHEISKRISEKLESGCLGGEK